MTSLENRKPKNTYKDLLQVSNSNTGVDATLRPVEDGEGTQSALSLSTTAARLAGQLDFTGTTHAGLKLLSLTTTQRDALSPSAGMVIHNTTTGQMEEYSGSAWVAGGAATAFTSVNPSTITLDGATDAAITLQAELDRITALGGGTLKLISASGIYLNSAVQQGSYATLDLSECPVTFGASGGLWQVGELAESPATGKPKLYADIVAGATSFDIVIAGANVTPSAGQQFILRGQRAATGAHLGKETGVINTAVHVGTVSGGERWTITPVDPIQADYSVRYTGDAYETATGLQDNSNFTISIFSAFTGNIAAGAQTATVGDASAFAIGDYVHVSDDENVGDSTSTTDTNLIHNEINRIAGISSNTVTFQNPLHHAYTTAHNGGIAKINPVIGARLVRPRVGYNADGGTGAYAFRQKYAVDCEMDSPVLSYSRVAGVNYGPYAMGFRLEYSFGCRILLPRYTGKPDAEIYSSAQGYGIVFHGSTLCKVIGATTENARHGVLFQYGAAGNEYYGFHDENSRISGIDFHGINAVKNHVHGGTIVGGPLSSPDSTNKVAIKIGNTSHIYGDHGNVVENVAVRNYQYFEGSVGGIGIQMLSQSVGNVIRVIFIDGCDYGLKLVSNSAYPTSILGANLLQDIILRNCGTRALNMDGGDNSAIAGIVLDHVISDGNAGHFEFTNVSGLSIERCGIRNSVASSGRYAVKSTNVTGLKVVGGIFDGANRGIYLKQSPAARILSNEFLNQVESEVFKDDTTTGNNNGYVWENNGYGGSASYTKTLGASAGTITERGASSSGGAGGNTTAYISGHCYAAVPIVSFSNKTVTAGRLYAVGPFFAVQNTTITKLGVNIVTGSSAGTHVALGVYTDSGGFPSSLVGGITGVALTDATGDAEVTGLSIPISAGTAYWLAADFESTPTINAAGSTTAYRYQMVTSTGTGAFLVKKTSAYSTSLPGTFPSSTVSDFAAEAVPHLWFRT